MKNEPSEKVVPERMRRSRGLKDRWLNVRGEGGGASAKHKASDAERGDNVEGTAVVLQRDTPRIHL